MEKEPPLVVRVWVSAVLGFGILLTGLALGWAANAFWRHFNATSNVVRLDGTVAPPRDGLVCITYKPDSVRPKNTQANLPSSATEACGSTASSPPVGASLHAEALVSSTGGLSWTILSAAK